MGDIEAVADVLVAELDRLDVSFDYLFGSWQTRPIAMSRWSGWNMPDPLG
jgi:hypothetical protein